MRYSSRLHIDLSIFAENVEKLRKLCPQNEIIFMVKANAYGHGVASIVQFSNNELGIREFGCASVGEAIYLRKKLPMNKFDIYVFSELNLGIENFNLAYLNQRILPVLNCDKDLDFVLGSSDFDKLPICLKFNTGMNRLGFDYQKVDELIKKIKQSGRNSIYHLMTHFSSASLSMVKNKKNIEQRARFAEIKSTFKAAGISVEKTSIANSGALEQGIGHEESHIRPGLMLYGPSSLAPQIQEKSLWNGRLISRLETQIIKTFPVTKGQPIGYGATPAFEKGIIGIISLGYGDGFTNNFQSVYLKHGNSKVRVVGRVNMDMAQILFPEDSTVIEGDLFEVWSDDSDLFQKICHQTKTIPYEIFCQLTSRIPRVYSIK